MRSIYETTFSRKTHSLLGFAIIVISLNSCSMGEEMRRIDESKRASQLRDASRTTNLGGDQLFVRSCNTCHPGGRIGMGPSLDKMDIDFPTDAALKKFIRKGKGMMPAQTLATMNDDELNSLVVFLRAMNADLKESK